ncbi:MAG: sigma-70 family RNA polymerase sigma factor, partial [Bacteroidales bacterium]|nr:sigma-70 family RNA polymerase sigma factor [Bacteroidales bacterium]
MTDDGQIIRLYKAGQREEAFNQIVKNYGERLYWHIRRIVGSHEDADDLLQNTFVKAWQALERFRGESGLYTWLYRIATNETLSFLSSKRVTSDVSLSEDPARTASLAATERGFDGDKLQRLLQ